MENSHLVKAHEHARNAATATYGNSVTAAGEAHALAAASFHEAAEDTHDAEALRILSLLEDHHHKLATIIKEPPRKKDKTKSIDTQVPESTASSPPPKSSTERTARTTSPSGTSSSTRTASRRRLPHSSIASNLAEKRGIPGARRSTPTSSPISVTNALASRNDRQSTPVRDLLQQQSKKAEEASKQQAKDEASSTRKESLLSRDTSPPPNDNFRRFYSAFGGVINAISAPLAFTSLPLNPGTSSSQTTSTSTPTSPNETPTPKPSQTPKHPPLDASHTTKSSEPDLASLISKPALHALRDNTSHPGGLGPFAKNESFYFVPTSGGTVSYANILRDQHGHPISSSHGHGPHHAAQDPHLDSITEGVSTSRQSLTTAGAGGGTAGSSHSNEDFVDARESFVGGSGPPSPTSNRRPPNSSSRPQSSSTKSTHVSLTPSPHIRAGRGAGLKSMEELQLENETLRSLIDKQARRLSMWETTSQNSYNALAQSFRARGGMQNMQKQHSDPTALAQALLAPGPLSPPIVPPVPSIPARYARTEPDVSRETRDHQSDIRQTKNESGREKDRDAETANAARIRDLEALLATTTTQLQSLQSENANLQKDKEKNTQVIGRYREQWEKLKASAKKKEVERLDKVRREAAEGISSGDAGSGSGMESSGGNGNGKGLGEDIESEGKKVRDADDTGEDRKTEEEAGAGFGQA